MTHEANTEGDMISNFATTEQSVGAEARKCISTYEKQIKRHDLLVIDIHHTIIAFGRLLQTGKDMYPQKNDFGDWIERRHLNTGRIADHQTKRTACMTIARLVEHGPDYAEIGEEAPPEPPKLDLAECKNTGPIDVMKWARKTHPHLFLKAKLKGGPTPEKDPGAKLTPAEQIAQLKTEVESLRQEKAELELFVIHLEQSNREIASQFVKHCDKPRSLDFVATLQDVIRAKWPEVEPDEFSGVPDFLKRSQIEQRALLAESKLADVKAAEQLKAEAAAKRKAKAYGRLDKMKAKQSGETKKMPLSGKAALKAIEGEALDWHDDDDSSHAFFRGDKCRYRIMPVEGQGFIAMLIVDRAEVWKCASPVATMAEAKALAEVHYTEQERHLRRR